MTDTESTPTSDTTDTRKRVLPVAAVAAVAVLIVALVLSVRDGTTGDDAADSSAPITEVSTSPSEPVGELTTDETTTSTMPPTSSTTPTTTIGTTPDSTVAPGPPATFTTEAPYFGVPTTVILDLVGIQNALTVYDGLVEVPELRCVALLAPAIDGWNEWCGGPNTPVRFLTGDGTTMWLVELGADVGSVTVTVPPVGWTLTANGCNSPVIDVLKAASPGPAVMTGAICVPGETFVNISATLLQPGSPDGGGAVVQQAADGTWTSLGGGTSYPCDDAVNDGVDRCGLYRLEVGDELFGALLPIPPLGGGSTTADVVAVRDATADVRGVIGPATTAADIGAIVAAAFRDGTDDPAPTVETFGQFGFWNVELVIVTIPAFDDSILSTTYALWVGLATNEPVVHAFTFETCARGLAGPDLCI